ncbi:protein ADP-ribosyltransferase PARP3 isoform X2 [Salvia miltiorrhiza]|uniref:protein ADP-ribosyltransferase PARP3 isoform X2 n=1 Tax=Salvia miltiorrhiza TaxID=226208 RepID=UPI0025AC6E5E|nr:protein ADP-ribosyltransferase PARP3 isoform X2 [Salvia miltiorrhiza]
MKVHETRSHSYSSGNEEKVATRKQKAEAKASEGGSEHSPKKAKTETDERAKDAKKDKTKGEENGNEKSTEEIKAEFEKFCKATSEYLSFQQMREILEANGQDASGSDDAVVPRCQDVLFYGPLDDCPACGGALRISDKTFTCSGVYTEWSSCTYNTKDPPRRNEPTKLPDFVNDSHVAELLKKHHDPESRPRTTASFLERPFKGMMISLAGRLTRTHSKIEKAGGKVANSVMGATCLVVSPAERERGGSSKLTEAMERGIPVVREAWLSDSIEEGDPRPLEAYDIASDLAVGGKNIPLYQQDPSEEALETITSELKIYGKRGVHKDTKLQDSGGQILENDGILYNCAFALSDKGAGLNEFCIMQLITVPEGQLYMYYKKGRIGDLGGADEKLEERDDVDGAIQEFAKQFEGVTGNKFEPWEREKKIQKKSLKLFPIDMDDGVEVRHGGLGLRQLGAAALHSKLEPKVAKFMKVLCSQQVYRYAMMEMGLDFPDLPVGMVTDIHLKRCEDTLLEFEQMLRTSKETGPRRDALWADFSQRMFTLLPSTRPYVFRDFTDIADHGAAALETIRDINVASRLIGDMSGDTLDDPLFDRYKKLGCSISPVEKDTDDYKMVVNYLEKTYEPTKVGEISYGVSVEDIFEVEVSAGPSFDEIKKLPNKVLLWCGTRSSNLLRHLQKSFLPSLCFLPVPGYMFGRAIVCSDAAAEAARYGFTAVDRPEGFLVLAVASLGEDVTELTGAPEDAAELEEKKCGVIGLGRKKTDESEHFMWNDVKVPCGKLVPSEHKDSPLEYNEYAVYDPEQVSIKFLVAVKFEEKDVEYDTASP